MKFWLSWTHSKQAETPFHTYVKTYGAGRNQSYSHMDAESEEQAKAQVLACYPDAQFKFCMTKPDCWHPHEDAFPSKPRNRR